MDQDLGVQYAFNYLVKAILMPEVGGYESMTQPDGTSMTELSPYVGAPLELGITDARYCSTSWWEDASECGYTWWECLHHIGFYLDEIMAIEGAPMARPRCKTEAQSARARGRCARAGRQLRLRQPRAARLRRGALTPARGAGDARLQLAHCGGEPAHGFRRVCRRGREWTKLQRWRRGERAEA